MWRPYKATKKEVLAFFEEIEVVKIRSLMDKFDYSYEGAWSRIKSLLREELIEPLLDKGTWGITKKGERRLLYYDHQ